MNKKKELWPLIRVTRLGICCRADKHVDPANILSLCVRVMTAKDNEGNKGEVTNITKMTIYWRVYKCVCKVRGSSICVFSYMDDVGSWYSRVEEKQQDDRCGLLMLVEL